MYVTVYNVTCWNEQRARLTYKPVKPVQNETFEYVDPDGKYKLLVEEVGSHICTSIFDTQSCLAFQPSLVQRLLKNCHAYPWTTSFPRSARAAHLFWLSDS